MGRAGFVSVTWIAIVVAFSAAFVAGCSSTEEAKSQPPDWMQGAVIWPDKVCAVGVSEPTYYVPDAHETAAEDCRMQLAHTISTEITSVMIDTASARNNSVEQASVAQTTATISEMVVENAEVVEFWLDSQGQMSDRKNITYALCCMPKAQ